MAIVDIDGTVADARHRLHLIADNATHDDWVAFFDAADMDPALEPGLEVVRELQTEHEIVWLTGRPERIRRLTERWLTQHDLPSRRLIMHPTDDVRPTAVVKLEQVRSIGAQFNIAVVMDDDPRVVQLLESDGYPTVLAGWAPWSNPQEQPRTAPTK